MVCIRCKMVVTAELNKLGIGFKSVELGEVALSGPVPEQLYEELRTALLRSGLELMNDKKGILIQRIKTVIVELVHYSEEPLVIKLPPSRC